ncbi:MAG: maleylpyruvate isomerase N-terminal domain-containing protein [Myxococcales bacterium]|nr:maleylpyruvate isomerase N-terminal domain-containing protein [Myxococcales bacterium]
MGRSLGPELLARWRTLFMEMCDVFAALDPKTRLEWFGPDMGVRMFATSRQMETWAHGQEIYDLLGLTREHTRPHQKCRSSRRKDLCMDFLSTEERPHQATCLSSNSRPLRAMSGRGAIQARRPRSVEMPQSSHKSSRKRATSQTRLWWLWVKRRNGGCLLRSVLLAPANPQPQEHAFVTPNLRKSPRSWAR